LSPTADLIERLKTVSPPKDREFAASDDLVRIESLRRAALTGSTASTTAWTAARDACADALLLYPHEPLLALWWLEAVTESEGFYGLAEGMDLIAAVLDTKWESPDYEVLAWIRDRLIKLILRVPLVANFTYTTILNSRWDPERAAAAIEAMKAADNPGLRASIAALSPAIDRLIAVAGQHSWARQPSYTELRSLPHQILSVESGLYRERLAGEEPAEDAHESRETQETKTAGPP